MSALAEILKTSFCRDSNSVTFCIHSYGLLLDGVRQAVHQAESLANQLDLVVKKLTEAGISITLKLIYSH